MNGPEHYQLAEGSIGAAEELSRNGRHDAADRCVQYAIAHAMLANAAAQALQHAQRDDWEQVAG